MRAPHSQTLSRAIALAEASTERGQEVPLTVAQVRALIYETTAQQGMVHYCDAAARSHAVSATEVWEIAGFSDVKRIIGCWCGRPDGLVFAVSITRPNGAWHLDIRSCALPARAGAPATYRSITASTPKRLRIQAAEDARNEAIRAEMRQTLRRP